MLARHDWITLYANGIRYLEKAPLMYWSMAASFTVFGPEDWAARLPLAIATLALFLVVYATGRRLFASDTAGFYAALILLTSLGIFIYTRIIIPDVIVCLWLSLAMLLFWISLEQPQPSRATAWGFAAACALNVLTKGLIGIVFPGHCHHLFVAQSESGAPATLASLFQPARLPADRAALASRSRHSQCIAGKPRRCLPAPGNVHGFFWFYFINEQVLRYLNGGFADYDTVPLLLFWGLLAAWLMPWIAFVFKAIVPVRTDQAWKLLAIWAAVVMIFFSFSTRQEYYVLPALPPLALMIGGGWAGKKMLCPRPTPHRWTPHRHRPVPCGSGGRPARRVPGYTRPPPAASVDISTLLTQNPGEYALSLGHLLDRTLALSAFRPSLILTAIALLARPLAT